MKKNKIIAEIGSTHDGKINLALKSIKFASKVGADIVKFQMHISEEETFRDAPNPPYFKSESRYEYFQRTSFKLNQWKKIIKTCKKNNVDFMCSPFSIKAVDILEKLNVKYYKIPSGEVTNLPLLKRVKSTNKYIYLSSGMSNYKEIDNAIKIFSRSKICLMQCTSQYPCEDQNVGLNIIQEFKKKYKNIDIGFSDHTNNNVAAICAANLGVSAIEKHFTLSKKLYGSDAKLAMEPQEFKKYCSDIRKSWRINSFKVNKNNIGYLRHMKKIFEKSIVLNRDIDKGSKIMFDDLIFLKPGDGLRADNYQKILGMKTRKNFKKFHKLKLKDLIK